MGRKPKTDIKITGETYPDTVALSLRLTPEIRYHLDMITNHEKGKKTQQEVLREILSEGLQSRLKKICKEELYFDPMSPPGLRLLLRYEYSEKFLNDQERKIIDFILKTRRCLMISDGKVKIDLQYVCRNFQHIVNCALGSGDPEKLEAIEGRIDTKKNLFGKAYSDIEISW
jgi:hypothetical protein